MFFKNSVLRCFAVFCGVLWCFVCVFLSVFYKTAQNKPKIIQNAQNEQNTNTLCAIQRNTVLCIFLSLKKCLQKKIAKHVQNIAKQFQNIRKTPQNTVFQKTLAKHHKTLAKHPQNTAKHRKIPQNTFANKTDRIS